MPFVPKGWEIVIILVVVLLIFGPKNLPKLGSAIGRTVKNLREGMDSGKKDDPEALEAEQDTSEPDEGASADGSEQDGPAEGQEASGDGK